jgi:hypothetical protein
MVELREAVERLRLSPQDESASSTPKPGSWGECQTQRRRGANLKRPTMTMSSFGEPIVADDQKVRQGCMMAFGVCEGGLWEVPPLSLLNLFNVVDVVLANIGASPHS